MERTGNERTGRMNIIIPVAASTVIPEGKLVAINSDGYAVEATKTTGLHIVGCSIRIADNRNGAAGDIYVNVRRGAFVWDSDGSISNTDILKDCYVENSGTVTLTSTGSSKAGVIIGVELDGIIVETL